MEKIIRAQRQKLSVGFFCFLGYFLKVKFGATITDARGSLAGNTYSRNHYGAYVRARTTPINPNTSNQQGIRNAIAYLADRWSSTLTSAQRAAWNLYGSSVSMTDTMGATMYLTGYNHFIRSNSTIARFGGAPIDDGPVIFELPAKDTTLAVTCSEAAQHLSISFDNTMAWANEDGAFIYFYQGQPQNAQRNFFNGPWRYAGGLGGNSTTPPTSPVEFEVPFAIAEGQRQWIYARIFRADGRLSEPMRADCFCAS